MSFSLGCLSALYCHLILTLLNPDFSTIENSVDPDQMTPNTLSGLTDMCLCTLHEQKVLFLHPMDTIFCKINVCVTQHKCNIQCIVDFQLIRIDIMHIILRVMFSSSVK